MNAHAAVPVADGADSGRRLVEALAGSKFYRDFEHAFSTATGLPLALRPVETWQLPHHGKPCENPFCALLATRSAACAACLQVQQQLASAATRRARTITCPVGLCESAVPVRVDGRVIGFLGTGQVLRKKPGEEQLRHAAAKLAGWGVQVDPRKARRAYEKSRVLSPKRYRAVLDMLTIFSAHLSSLGNQIAAQQAGSEPCAVTRARRYIEEHQAGRLSLGEVAHAVNTSTFYFCKIFKKATGLTFTDYVSRVRLETARNLLANPGMRVGEIAFAVGFQSLTHFNRSFKKVVGMSPRAYRAQITGAAP